MYRPPDDSIVATWRTEPILPAVETAFRPLARSEIKDALPSYQEGVSADETIPPIWTDGDHLIVLKKSKTSGGSLFLDRLATTIGHCVNAPVAPARIAQTSQNGICLASLVMDPQATRSPETICRAALQGPQVMVQAHGGYLPCMVLDALGRTALLDILINNSDNDLSKHFLFSPEKGICTFDFGTVENGNRCDLYFLKQFTPYLNMSIDDVHQIVQTVAMTVNLEPAQEDAVRLKEFAAHKPSIRDLIDQTMIRVETRLARIRQGDLKHVESPRSMRFYFS